MPAHPNPHQDELAELALKRVMASGAEYGDIRLLDSMTQTIRGEDRRIASIREAQDSGFGIRVLYHGAWGFAASSAPVVGGAPRVAELAIEIAKGSASLAKRKGKTYGGAGSSRPGRHRTADRSVRRRPRNK